MWQRESLKIVTIAFLHLWKGLELDPGCVLNQKPAHRLQFLTSSNRPLSGEEWHFYLSCLHCSPGSGGSWPVKNCFCLLQPFGNHKHKTCWTPETDDLGGGLCALGGSHQNWGTRHMHKLFIRRYWQLGGRQREHKDGTCQPLQSLESTGVGPWMCVPFSQSF